MAQRRDRGARTRGLYQRGTTWWCRTDPVTGRRVSTGCRDVEAALAWLRHRELLGASPAHAAAESERLERWIEGLLSELQTRRAPATLEVAQQKLGHFLRLWPGCRLADVAPPLVDRYVATRRSEGAGDLTISREIAHLARVMRRAARAGRWGGDPNLLRPLDLRAEYHPRKRALTPEEVEALLRALSPRRAAVVAMAVATGARRSELWSLTLEGSAVRIPGTKTAGSDRLVPILSVFRPLLALAAPHLPLEPWGAMSRDLDRACVRAGIPRCTPTDLRRTHATILRELGVDRDVVRRLLGHATTALVDRVYGQPRPALLAARAEEAIESVQKRHSADAPIADPGATSRNRPADLRFTTSVSGTPDQRVAIESRGVTAHDSTRESLGSGTDSAHPAAWALALALRDVMARRAA